MTESKNTHLWIIALGAIGLIAILVGGLVLLMPRQAANETAVNAANSLVESGHAAEAIQIYEQLIAAGGHDSALYYNLGNAYYANGDLPNAVANYRLATALAPRDPDIRANLDKALLASPALVATTPTGASGFLSDLTSGWLSMDEAAVIVAVLWFLALMLFLVARLRGKPARWLNTSAFVLLLMTLVLGLSLGSRALDAAPGSSLLNDALALAQLAVGR